MEYRIPAGYGTGEFVEKKSRFIGELWPVRSQEEAREKIDQVKKHYHDARHSCWCFLLRDGTLRYSDDGEPQGTAGQPMLEVFQREGVTDLVCVVTRYFGGILLGTGGLARAYTRGAKEALNQAGILVERPWDRLKIACPYRLFEQVRRETELAGGCLEDQDFGAEITLTALLPVTETQGYLARLGELSAGCLRWEDMGRVRRGGAPSA